jgi:hypothetical protein
LLLRRLRLRLRLAPIYYTHIAHTNALFAAGTDQVLIECSEEIHQALRSLASIFSPGGEFFL